MSSLLDLFQTNETRAENLTCGSVGEDSGDPEQKLILKWHPDSEMVFFFRKKNVSSAVWKSYNYYNNTRDYVNFILRKFFFSYFKNSSNEQKPQMKFQFRGGVLFSKNNLG